MTTGDQNQERGLAAGEFTSWLVAIRASLHEEAASQVPCGGCTACCRSSQFVHIGPDETETLSHIPAELLFPAPGSPRGHVLLGYDQQGHCPMLINDRCSIYQHRPRTCRTYDCRVFPAAGVEVAADHGRQVLIAERTRRWRFSYATEIGRLAHRAVQAAATRLAQHADLWPGGAKPTNPTEIALAAIEIHGLFLGCDEASGRATFVDPDADTVRAELTRATSAQRTR